MSGVALCAGSGVARAPGVVVVGPADAGADGDVAVKVHLGP
jgi:hypothetical protein